MDEQERVGGICRECTALFSRVIEASAGPEDWRRHYCQPECCPAEDLVVGIRRASCPTPSKKTYPGEGAALEAAFHASRSLRKAIRWYPCECGMWHLTSMTAAPGERTMGPRRRTA